MFVFKREMHDRSQVIVTGLVRVASPFASPLFLSPLSHFLFLPVVSLFRLLLHDVTSAFLFYYSIFVSFICLEIYFSLSLLSFS